ncbi:hypothetical protein LCGC14_1604880 [marine sediment metagenome]|uniref:Uncharacterized protein n=1 Tax=marine sediment metagenome TaxID=412755 RepID=A0A0F9LA26_9ZZZZ
MARRYGAAFKTVNISKLFNFPAGRIKGRWWKQLAEHLGGYPKGKQQSWGIPFAMGARRARTIIVSADRDEVTIRLSGRADYLCLLHEWRQLQEDEHWDDPTEGLVVGEYELTYSDGSTHVQPCRSTCTVRSTRKIIPRA